MKFILVRLSKEKTTSPNHKVKKTVRKAPEEWCRTEHAHEAIIAPAQFDLVQRLMLDDTRSPQERNVCICFRQSFLCWLRQYDGAEDFSHEWVQIHIFYLRWKQGWQTSLLQPHDSGKHRLWCCAGCHTSSDRCCYGYVGSTAAGGQPCVGKPRVGADQV